MTQELKIETEQDFKRACLRGAWRGLRSQGFRKAANGGGVCVWRTPDGRRCAVGWLIPDKALSRAGWAHGTAYSAVGDWKLAPPLQKWAARNPHRAARLLWELQGDHDTPKTPSGMEGALRRRAKRWGVELPEDGQ